MRRGFGRRRRKPAEETTSELDASELTKVGEAGLVDVPLEPLEVAGVPKSLALFGRGTPEEGPPVWVARAVGLGEAVAAALVLRAQLQAEEGDGDPPRILAVAGEARDADRLQLAALGALPDGLTSQLLDRASPIAKPGPDAPVPSPMSWFSDRIQEPRRRLLTERALDGLAGLAAKHGGCLRAHGETAELVVSARTVASLAWQGESLTLQTLLPQRSQAEVSLESLSDLLDRLEGNIRKRLGDRRVRDGEEGLRGRVAIALTDHLGLRSAVLWPLAGRDPDPIDAVGIGAGGELVVAAVREEFGLAQALEVMAGMARVRELLPSILSTADGPIFAERLRLVVAANAYEDAVEVLLAQLRFPMELLSIQDDSRALPRLVAKGEASGVAAPSSEARENRRGRNRRGRGRRRGSPESAPETSESPEVEESATPPEPETAVPEEPVVEEMSLFDLDDDSGDADGGRRRRRRGRRRGGRSSSKSEGEEAVADPPASPQAPQASEEDEDIEVADLDDDGHPIVDPEAPDLEDRVEVNYDEAELEEEPLTEAERLRLERERRRLARKAALPADESESEEAEGESVASEEFRMPRGRPAILAGADRQSLAAALVLARDVRNIEGIWIYPAGESMTFFRGVATDLRENTPIFVVGHPARPARDSIQAAALYRDRLVWFDHHEWAPEDEGGMREAIGSPALHLTPGLEGPLAAVLTQCTRRSRFTDKLVDLATGRFTQHDFERWGRLWWTRLGELSGKSGPVGSALDPLFAGRPSDLAKEAARQPTPEAPPELEFVGSRDFRLIHFGGFGLVLVDVPEELDLHLTARLVRERYDVALSLAGHEGSEARALASDDVSGRRAIDCGSMVEHLVAKLTWVEALPDADHVARLRIRDLARSPERLEEVVAEIAMGRSLLEG